ncbi:hypothetical protein H1D32_08290 [Anaerobacillus sp. CMMVII]|uniref:hypothetical protein n=1 Tax=Anaerobacillus sp. CMMVII TaxID=2755588 RepID=UPI0021B72A29|nr:hypothetical protein [Anaerobacillus sp. CMMVII]MCT8137757.1 hypothetical protein [Anaerobacillus sp. CMMVII]
MNEYYEDNVESPFEVEKSLQQFEKEKQTNDLVEEILELSMALSQYQINFEDLEKYSPKHRDTRENLVEMADRFVTDDDCVAQFLRKKQFPTTLFVKNTGYRAKQLSVIENI